jgi:PAS domain S-box-containing protein
MAKKIPSEMSNLKSKISNPQSLRVLMVEDSEDDMLLIIRELKKGGYDPVHEKVETEKAMSKALREKPWDVILCDYKLPKFSGTKAIAVLKETNIDIPIIIVSGAIGEETAIECMRLGAHDYIMKNNLWRLCPAITRELEEAGSRSKRKQAEEALRESEALYRSQFEDHSAVKLLIDPDTGNIIDANEAAANFYGWSRENLKQMKIQEINTLPPEEVIKAMETVRTQKRIHFEFRHRRADGSIRNVDVFSSKIKAKGKDILHSIIHDITERKRAEEALRESEERYKALFDRSLDLVYIADFEGRFIDANDAALNRLGYTREEIHSLNFASLLSEDQLPLAVKTLQEIRETGIHMGLMEFRLRHKNGSEVYVETRGSTLMSNGTPVAIQSIARDITERKRAEEALRQSEAKYRTILENIDDGYYELDLNGNFTFFNAPMCRIIGYPQEEMMGMNNRQFTDKENAKKLFKTFNEVYRTGEPAKEFDWQIIRKDGAKRYVEVSVSLQKNSSGNPIGFRGIARDITERREAEEALQKSEHIYHLLAEHMTDIVWVMDMDLNVTWLSPSAMKARGFSVDEIAALPLDRQLTPESLRKAVDWLGKLMRLEKDGLISEPDGILSRELEFYCKDGRTIVLDCTFQFIRDEQGKATGILAEGRNITALRESEERYKALFDRSLDLVYINDFEGRFIDANDAVLNRLGYTKEEILSLNFASLLSEDQLPLAVKTIQELRETGIQMGLTEFRLRHKNGSDVYVETRGSTIISNGTPVAIQRIARDITERKQAEEKLRRSEEKYRTIIENMQEGYFEMDLAGNYTFVNDAECRNLGYPKEELIGMNNRQYQDETSAQKTYQLFRRLYRTGEPAKALDVEIIRKNGAKGFNEVSVSLIRDAEGKPIGFRGISRDITERKQMEEKLQQTLDSLKKAIAATIQIMMSAVEVRDPYTAGHQLRSTNLACAIATERGLAQEKIDGIRMAGSIHDIGKLSIPAEILAKPTKLTTIEFSLIKEHSRSGYEMLKDVESPWPLAQIVYQHHERMDGSGYPRNLKGDDILMEARIMAVADVVESMASHRPYRPALGIDLALEEISRNKGILYDVDAVDACLKLFREKGYTLVLKK